MKKSLEASIFGISSPEPLRVAVGELARLDALALGRLRDRLAVLVGAGQEEHVLAALAHVAGEDVGADRRVRVAEVGLGVDVVDRRGDVVAHGRPPFGAPIAHSPSSLQLPAITVSGSQAAGVGHPRGQRLRVRAVNGNCAHEWVQVVAGPRGLGPRRRQPRGRRCDRLDAARRDRRRAGAGSRRRVSRAGRRTRAARNSASKPWVSRPGRLAQLQGALARGDRDRARPRRGTEQPVGNGDLRRLRTRRPRPRVPAPPRGSLRRVPEPPSAAPRRPIVNSAAQ